MEPSGPGSATDRPKSNSAKASGGDSTDTPAGVYDATVDRTVDDQVVVLLADDGAVVEQFVLPRKRLPAVEEGDTLLVFLLAGALKVLWTY